jgi:hypothetical protein
LAVLLKFQSSNKSEIHLVNNLKFRNNPSSFRPNGQKPFVVIFPALGKRDMAIRNSLFITGQYANQLSISAIRQGGTERGFSDSVNGDETRTICLIPSTFANENGAKK